MSRIRDIANILTAANDLSTDAETAAAILSAVPAQSGNSGKYLTTNGSATSWGTIPITSAATPTTLGTVYGLTEGPDDINANTGFGWYALNSVDTANGTTALGQGALSQLTDGLGNLAIGTNAGGSPGNSLTSGSNNILIGTSSSPSSATVSNEITLGNQYIEKFRVPGLGIDWNKNIEIMTLMGAY